MTSKGTKLSVEEWRQKQDIEAARKAGTLPAEIDAISGMEINPHIPQFMAQAPWYLDAGEPTITHQKSSRPVEPESKDWYARGARSAELATKYRKGACENCGAMTHKTKDCLERPRKLGAKVTGKDIQADEVLQSFELGFDGKRDRYNGFDPETYISHIQEWEKVEEKRKAIRAKEFEEKLAANPDGAATLDGVEAPRLDEDEDKYAEDADVAGQKFDLKTRTTVRHLRIREDTAKYLRNLDVNSAYYDPKTRSMRDNPNKDRDAKDLDFAGDNFVRYSGETKQVMEIQRFAWEANERGVDVNLQANPTQAELLNRGFHTKKDELKEKTKHSILERYGGAEHLEAPPKELLLAQTEQYVEYSRTGQVIKGVERRLAKSRYEEDVFTQNHTAVWGSFWEDGRWGYACCHQFIKNSYCTGRAGIEARQQSEAAATGNTEAFQAKREDDRRRQAEQDQEDGHQRQQQQQQKELQKDKDEKKSLRDLVDEKVWRKRKYNSMESHEYTDEDYTQYLKKKELFDDPMRNYVDQEDKTA